MMKLTVLLAALGFSLAAAVLAYSLARRISVPINALTDASGELSEALGDLQEEANNQRDTMISLREKIDANQHRVADEVFKL